MRIAVLLLVASLLVGCDARIERFRPNRVFGLTLAASQSLPTKAAQDDASAALEALFGSPDEPRWPEALTESNPFVDLARLRRAAGPVSSERDGTHRGLFREHCVTCHGVEGDGAGPASLFQNPYPRDFRHGVFKWKSTERAAKPTREDLYRVLSEGVPGTAMPSFASLDPADLEALVDYVIYLSIRGEVERRMLIEAIFELDYGEEPPEEQAWRLVASGDTEGSDVVADIVSEVGRSWREADEHRVRSGILMSVDEQLGFQGDRHEDSIERGKEVFHGQIANCVGCHGPEGNGQLETLDFDDWTKEYTTRLGLTPSDRESIKPFRDAGALRPRPIHPRPLKDGVFRGGDDELTLYARITQGIAGTPMPGVAVVDQENGKGLTPVQIWDLIQYVRSLAKP